MTSQNCTAESEKFRQNGISAPKDGTFKNSDSTTVANFREITFCLKTSENVG